MEAPEMPAALQPTFVRTQDVEEEMRAAGILFADESIEELANMAAELQAAPNMVRDHHWQLAKHHNTFRSSDAVNWLIQNAYADTVPAAERLGERMLQAGLIVRRCGDSKGFSSSRALYRFRHDLGETAQPRARPRSLPARIKPPVQAERPAFLTPHPKPGTVAPPRRRSLPPRPRQPKQLAPGRSDALEGMPLSANLPWARLRSGVKFCADLRATSEPDSELSLERPNSRNIGETAIARANTGPGRGKLAGTRWRAILLARRAAASEADVEALRAANCALETKLRALRWRLASCSKARDDARHALRDAEAERRALQWKHASASRSKANVEQENASLLETLQSVQEDAQEAWNEMKRSQAELLETKAKLAEAEVLAEREHGRAEDAQHGGEVMTTLRVEATAAREELKSLRTEHAAALNQIDRDSKLIAELRKNLDVAHSELQTSRAAMPQPVRQRPATLPPKSARPAVTATRPKSVQRQPVAAPPSLVQRPATSKPSTRAGLAKKKTRPAPALSRPPRPLRHKDEGREPPRCFTLERLQRLPCPAGVDVSHRERYLSAEDFKATFAMRRKEFDALPQWKRSSLKRKAKLF